MLVQAAFDQPRPLHAIHQPAHARRAKVERRAGLAHQRAIVLAEEEQHSGLRRGDATGGGARLCPSMQPTLTDIQEVDKSRIQDGTRVI
ncbi:hypothetical protein Cmtc_39900 [Cupriavidus sp. TKC]|nr:hypothetical protein Cmtc_39900 [Cupriavidus sp. TKC]